MCKTELSLETKHLEEKQERDLELNGKEECLLPMSD